MNPLIVGRGNTPENFKAATRRSSDPAEVNYDAIPVGFQFRITKSRFGEGEPTHLVEVIGRQDGREPLYGGGDVDEENCLVVRVLEGEHQGSEWVVRRQEFRHAVRNGLTGWKDSLEDDVNQIVNQVGGEAEVHTAADYPVTLRLTAEGARQVREAL